MGAGRERLRSTNRIPILPIRDAAHQAGPFEPFQSAGEASLAEARVSGRRLGGEYRARTGDLLVANQALSQLS